MIELINYKIIFKDKTIQYNNITIKEKEFVGLSGESGCGKTSLLNSIFGYNFNGIIKYDKANILGEDMKTITNKYKYISYCPQFCQDALNPKITIKKHIELVLSSNNIVFSPNNIKEILNKLSLDEKILNMYPYMLSGGQKQRIVLLLCTIKNPKLLVLDEPSSALDSITLKIIADFLVNIKKEENTIFLVSHNTYFLKNICDKIIYL